MCRRHKTSDSIDTITMNSSVHSISGGASSTRGAIDGSEKLLPLLKQISEWTLAIPLQVYPANRSIFESANLVRVLLRAPEFGVRHTQNKFLVAAPERGAARGGGSYISGLVVVVRHLLCHTQHSLGPLQLSSSHL